MDLSNDKTIQAILALFVTGSFVAACGVLLFAPPKDTVSQITVAVIGVLSGVGFSQVMNFYFGSSTSSRAKDAIIAGQLPPSSPPPLISVDPAIAVPAGGSATPPPAGAGTPQPSVPAR